MSRPCFQLPLVVGSVVLPPGCTLRASGELYGEWCPDRPDQPLRRMAERCHLEKVLPMILRPLLEPLPPQGTRCRPVSGVAGPLGCLPWCLSFLPPTLHTSRHGHCDERASDSPDPCHLPPPLLSPPLTWSRAWLNFKQETAWRPQAAPQMCSQRRHPSTSRLLRVPPGASGASR